MACDAITKGRKMPCNDSTGGVKWIDFAPYDSTYSWAITGEELTALPEGLEEVFRYELKGTGNNLTETATVNQDNGTTEIAKVVSGVLQKLGAETQVQVRALLYGTCIAFVRDKNNKVHAVGIETGLAATAGAKQTGGAGTDLSGYTFSLQELGANMSPILSSTAVTALNALVSEETITA